MLLHSQYKLTIYNNFKMTFNIDIWQKIYKLLSQKTIKV